LAVVVAAGAGPELEFAAWASAADETVVSIVAASRVDFFIA
jgi:hypothetical protein